MIVDCNLLYTNILRENRGGGPQDPIAQYPPSHLGYIKFLNTVVCCLKMLPIFLAVTTVLNKQALYCQKAQPKVTVPQTLGWTWTKQWPENSNRELCNIWPLLQLSELVSVRLCFPFQIPFNILLKLPLLQVVWPYHLWLLNNYWA